MDFNSNNLNESNDINNIQNEMPKEKKKKEKVNIPLKKRLALSALTGFLISFTICIYGVLDIYLNNSEQFSFYLADFLGYLFLYGFLFFAFITLLISIFNGRAFYVVISLFFWVAVMLYIQGNFLNFGISSLMGDDLQENINVAYYVINVILWVVTGIASVLLALLIKNKRMLFNVCAIVLITIIGMQLVSCAVQLAPKAVTDGKTTENTKAPDESSTPADASDSTTETETEEETKAPPVKNKTVLTSKGLFEVSGKNNIIIFIFDRFDATYFDKIKEDTDFFKPLDGFTYYSDYTTLYCRTYPAVTSIITGLTNDFSGTAEEYFTRAYTQSKFLSDLKKNDYKIKLYTTSYYAYRDNTRLTDIADNEYSSSSYKVKDANLLAFKMIGLSAYRYFPTALKDTINLSSSSFSGHVELSSDYPKYEKNDAKLYKELVENGLTVQSDESNNYIFIHLNGCHPPYQINEHGLEPVEGESVTVESALKGSFKFVYEYIDNLKELGLYDNSTIIITGDHAAARSDTKDVYNPRITSLFVKYRGESGTDLQYSDIPVSQDSLIATLIESEGITTTNNYGKSLRDFTESEKDTIERRYFFQKSVSGGKDEIIEYKITGDGWDFDNWEIVKRTVIGKIYK